MEPVMIEIIDPNDSRAVRNKNNVLALYDLMINTKKSEEGTPNTSARLHPAQPLIADGSMALGSSPRSRERAGPASLSTTSSPSAIVYSIDFLNLFNDDPNDTGIAGVDIYKMDADGKAIEHWDTLQVVGDPKNSAPLLAPNIPRANPNGMF